MSTYFVTWAQNGTPRHKGFWASALSFAEHNDAEICVQAGRYKNPTSVFLDEEEDDWYDEEVAPHLAVRWHKGDAITSTPKRRKFAGDLTFFSDVPTQPTASDPLSGFEVFLGQHRSSGIFGHPKRALRTIATGSRTPRFAFTTGACTVANYTDSKAGKKGAAHHVLGGLVVEVDDDGSWYVRQVTASGPTGKFTDLDKVYSPKGVKKAPRAAAVVPGDIHEKFRDNEALAALQAVCELLRPRHLVVHDVLDFHARNHHVKTSTERYDRHAERVETEVTSTCELLEEMARWCCAEVDVVHSNHHVFFETWLEKHDSEADPANDPYHSRVKARRYDYRDATGTWPELFELEARHLGVPAKVRFLRRNDSLLVLDVELAFHGHKGKSGSRGSARAYARLGVKTIIGHSHEPGIFDGCWQNGHLSLDDHHYNDLPGAWAKTLTVLHADGKRQMLFTNKNRFRGDA